MQAAALSPWLSPNTLRCLADKLYEKRKGAALEVEQARTRCRRRGRSKWRSARASVLI
jgi:hypothetical protein